MKKGKRGFNFNLIGHTYVYNMHFRSYGILIFFWFSKNRDKIATKLGLKGKICKLTSDSNGTIKANFEKIEKLWVHLFFL